MKAEDAHKLARHNINNCFLCGDKEVITIGCLVPNKNWTIVIRSMGKLPKRKTRTLWYGLCEKCFKIPNKEELIEEKIGDNIIKRVKEF